MSVFSFAPPFSSHADLSVLQKLKNFINTMSFSSPTPTQFLINAFLLLQSQTLFFLTLQADHVNPTTKGTCHDTCGTVPVKYPFGTEFGCGHPDFARYVKCNGGTLQLTTGAGSYTISSIDYPSNTIIVTDPLMSNCTSMQNSGSFSLDRASPFTIADENIFVLLGCSTTSPVFDPDQDLCDTGSGYRVCRGMYSCKGVAGIGLPTNSPASTCCVYDSPMGFGSGYELDLPKLQCSSYTSIYEFGDEGDPMKWRFGVLLEYNDSYYSSGCRDCEESQGFCGFSGLDQSFACICPNGMNTTVNCFGRGYAWSGTRGLGVFWCLGLYFSLEEADEERWFICSTSVNNILKETFGVQVMWEKSAPHFIAF
ncbi:hypothetical protein G4B88_019110 [Cannabis sativa]|uniref:non-specific serine/threonine protein kinase n=1 Tax=Cannabis sativa TaxID=3483 RepID=A0A7J6HPQ4_CANSA|nr:hypothetical protein G4B88_019110 [Cannabis sativa]